MKIVSGDYSITIDPIAPRAADLSINSPTWSGAVELSNMRAAGDTLTAAAQILFLDNVPLIITVSDTSINVNISHTWFADGDHVFDLDSASIAEARQFMKGYE